MTVRLLHFAVLLGCFCHHAAADDTSMLAGPEFFSTDSRRWSRVGEAVMLTDFSKAEPATALVTGKREKGKWKLIPWASAESQGMALSAYSQTNPAVVRLPLAARGWHAAYVGLATVSGGFDIGPNGIRTRLSDEQVYLRMACNLELLANRRAVIQEQFLTVPHRNIPLAYSQTPPSDCTFMATSGPKEM